LQRGGIDLILGDWGLEVEERLDAATHETYLDLSKKHG
jgi:hypothetical protein